MVSITMCKFASVACHGQLAHVPTRRFETRVFVKLVLLILELNLVVDRTGNADLRQRQRQLELLRSMRLLLLLALASDTQADNDGDKDDDNDD